MHALQVSFVQVSFAPFKYSAATLHHPSTYQAPFPCLTPSHTTLHTYTPPAAADVYRDALQVLRRYAAPPLLKNPSRSSIIPATLLLLQVSFVMPSKYSTDTLPRPHNPNVTIREVPARTLAAISFSGNSPREPEVRCGTHELLTFFHSHDVIVNLAGFLAHHHPHTIHHPTQPTHPLTHPAG